jgi:ABC-type phosphate transport system substrate-binding protein
MVSCWRLENRRANGLKTERTTRMNARTKAMMGLAMAAWAVGIQGARAQSAIEVDPNLPVYERVEGVAGNLNSIGSDTLNNLMALWAEGFRAIYPNVNIQIEGKGSSTAPPALIEGTAQLGPMSREMKSSEIDAFEKQFGYVPTEVKVAVDALAVFVHKDNPLAGLTLKQIDSVFSSTFKSGGESIDTWDQLGLGGEFQGRADLALRPQQRLGHLRVLQGERAEQGRLPGDRQGAAGIVVGRDRHRQ